MSAGLPMEKIVAIIIMLLVLTAVFYFLFIGRASGSSVVDQYQIQGCCDKYRANNCQGILTNIQCGDKTLAELTQGKMDMSQLKKLCDCP